jgi:hypothetical protein
MLKGGEQAINRRHTHQDVEDRTTATGQARH